MRTYTKQGCVALLFGLLSIAGCSMAGGNGPGFTTTFSGSDASVSILVTDARLPNGHPFPNAMSFGFTADPRTGGATEGYAPDGRELPEYVDFAWQEWPSPYPPEPSDPVEEQKWARKVDELSRTLPIKRYRVYIKRRIPQDVVDEVVAANRHRKSGHLPDADLHVYFIWAGDAIKFHWELERRKADLIYFTERAGGDDLAQVKANTSARH